MKSIEFIKKEMDILYENSNNYTSNEYLIMSNKLKKEYEKAILNKNKKPIEDFYFTEQLLDFDYYYENMIMF
jgi:hypothetical protein